MEFFLENLEWVLTAIFGLIAMVFGTKWTGLKSKLGSAIKEGADVIEDAIDLADLAHKIIDDDKVTPEEVEQFKTKAKEMAAEWKELLALFKKNPAIPVE